MAQRKPAIAIIGAGIAGLTAAATLRKAGFEAGIYGQASAFSRSAGGAVAATRTVGSGPALERRAEEARDISGAGRRAAAAPPHGARRLCADQPRPLAAPRRRAGTHARSSPRRRQRACSPPARAASP